MINIVIGEEHKKTVRRPPDCLKCVHFYVTWDSDFPRGCHVFGFKTKQLPSVEVLHATSMQCPSFELKSNLK